MLINEGIAIQERVEAAATPLPTEARQVPELISQDITVHGVPAFKNHKLRIMGQPDGIETAQGEALPGRDEVPRRGPPNVAVERLA